MEKKSCVLLKWAFDDCNQFTRDYIYKYDDTDVSDTSRIGIAISLLFDDLAKVGIDITTVLVRCACVTH